MKNKTSHMTVYSSSGNENATLEQSTQRSVTDWEKGASILSRATRGSVAVYHLAPGVDVQNILCKDAASAIKQRKNIMYISIGSNHKKIHSSIAQNGGNYESIRLSVDVFNKPVSCIKIGQMISKILPEDNWRPDVVMVESLLSLEPNDGVPADNREQTATIITDMLELALAHNVSVVSVTHTR